MATNTKRGVDVEESDYDYAGCIITPMTSKDGKPLIRPVHLVDATIVGGIVFFSLLLGASLPGVVSGNVSYLGPEEVANRLVTAMLAFGLTFLAQWARYRGVQMLSVLSGETKDSEDSDS